MPVFIKPCPAKEILEARYCYDPDTGIFTSRKSGQPVGYLTERGYIRIDMSRSGLGRHMAHRLAWVMAGRELPEGAEVDHRNGVRSDNRLVNLRAVPKAVNQRNAKKRSDNKSGITGVSFHKSAKKWVAIAAVNGANKHLGCFNSAEEAKVRLDLFRRQNGFTERHGS